MVRVVRLELTFPLSKRGRRPTSAHPDWLHHLESNQVSLGSEPNMVIRAPLVR